MKLAQVTGTVTAVVKDAEFVGAKLLLVDFVDGKGKVIEPAVVAVDSVGAGVGDQVLVACGSAARVSTSVSVMPVDASIVAIVDYVSVG